MLSLFLRYRSFYRQRSLNLFYSRVFIVLDYAHQEVVVAFDVGVFCFHCRLTSVFYYLLFYLFILIVNQFQQ